MNILIIEDDEAVRDSVQLMLKGNGIETTATAFGEDGIALARTTAFDLVLLDLNLPDINGVDVLRSLREAGIDTPILIMSGDATVEVKVRTLKQGADDCIAKPFHKDELIARIKAVVRRNKVQEKSVIEFGDVVVDPDSKTVEADGVRVALTVKEYTILEPLLLRKGSTLTKAALLEHLYGGMDEPEQKIIDVFVCKLRKKLAVATHGVPYIKTVWGLGYCWSEPDTAIAA